MQIPLMLISFTKEKYIDSKIHHSNTVILHPDYLMNLSLDRLSVSGTQ